MKTEDQFSIGDETKIGTITHVQDIVEGCALVDTLYRLTDNCGREFDLMHNEIVANLTD